MGDRGWKCVYRVEGRFCKRKTSVRNYCWQHWSLMNHDDTHPDVYAGKRIEHPYTTPSEVTVGLREKRFK